MTRGELAQRCAVSSRPGHVSFKDYDGEQWARWAAKAVNILKTVGARTMADAGEAEDAGAAERAILGSVRASTLQARVRPLEAMIRWLEWRRGYAWPRRPADIFDYLAERQRDDPQGSFPRSLLAGIAWLEARSGFAESQKYANNDVVKKWFQRADAEAGEHLGEVKRAPRFPLALVAAMELLVGGSAKDKGTKKTKAVICWMRLLKIYGGMRMDDLQRVAPRSVVVGDAGLTLKLLRTKCSGPGKKVRELTVFIPRGTGFANTDWLLVGLGLWRSVVVMDADCFMPRPMKDLGSFTARMASLSDLSGLGVHCMIGLKFNDEVVLDERLVAELTGHSERCTLQSWLALLGVPKSDREFMGRWSASGADDYVRTDRGVVRRLLKLIADSASAGDAYALFDESEAVERLEALATKRRPELADSLAGAARESKRVAREILSCLTPTALQNSNEGDMSKIATVAAEADPGGDDEQEAQQPEVKYVISEDRKRKKTCLHKAGGCYRVRSLSFASYDLITGEVPPLGAYMTYCKSCWKEGAPELGDYDADEDVVDDDIEVSE